MRVAGIFSFRVAGGVAAYLRYHNPWTISIYGWELLSDFSFVDAINNSTNLNITVIAHDFDLKFKQVGHTIQFIYRWALRLFIIGSFVSNRV